MAIKLSYEVLILYGLQIIETFPLGGQQFRDSNYEFQIVSTITIYYTTYNNNYNILYSFLQI